MLISKLNKEYLSMALHQTTEKYQVSYPKDLFLALYLNIFINELDEEDEGMLFHNTDDWI